jgi:hypothetical protein
MKSKNLVYAGVMAALFITLPQFYSCQRESESDVKEESKNESLEENHKEEFEVAELMFHNQRYLDKLYFAGKNNNWQLAEFYHHELEENMEKLVEGHVTEDEINLSDLAKKMYLPASEELKKSIESRDVAVFRNGYDFMVKTCNNCHIASKHGFIQITTPDQPTYRNQLY